MITDSSYFVGPFTIAQLGHVEVENNLNSYIEQYETEYLEKALGYGLSKSFIDGLIAGGEKWLNLINGYAFVDRYGRNKKWKGFVGAGNTSIALNVYTDPLFLEADVTAGFVSGTRRYENADLVNWNFTIEKRTVGELEKGVEWVELEDGGWELTDETYELFPNELWLVRYVSRKIDITPVDVKNVSPIVAYIYWHYVKDLHEQQTGIGTVKTKGQNSTVVSPISKMINAWEFVVKGTQNLNEFLFVNQEVYTDYDPSQFDRELVVSQNQFGI